MKQLAGAILILLFLCLSSQAAQRAPITPTAQDKCPVCGMFTKKYIYFIAQILYEDGSYATFDGPKDLFKYYLNLPRYAADRQPSEIEAIYVTDYYSLDPIDARKAFFVIGSDVYGPMGKELIPLEKEGDVEEFINDHKGKAIRFEEITQKVLDKLN